MGDEYSDVDRRLVRRLRLPPDEKAIVRLYQAVEGFLRFRGLDPSYLETCEFMEEADEFWADVADSMRPERIDAKGLFADRKSEAHERMDGRMREYKRNLKHDLYIAECLATLGHAEAMALARAFTRFFDTPDLPVPERLRAAGLLREL